MGIFGGGGSTETRTEPWREIQDELARGADAAQRLMEGRPTVYDGHDFFGRPLSLAAMTPEERRAYLRESMGVEQGGLAEALAAGGLSPEEVQAVTQGTNLGVIPLTPGERQAAEMFLGVGDTLDPLRETVEGKYLTPDTNPYLEGMYEAASRGVTDQFQQNVLPSLRDQFTLAGQTASGPGEQFEAEHAASQVTQQLSDMAANMYGTAYERERQRQAQAMQLLPQFTDAAAQAALRGGNIERVIPEAILRMPEQAAMDPWEQEAQYNQALQPGLRYGTTVEPYSTNPLATTLGGAATGAAAGSAFGPWGTLIGGGAGAFLGLLGSQ